MAATVAEFIAGKLGPNDTSHNGVYPDAGPAQGETCSATASSKPTIAKSLRISPTPTGDPWQWAYEQTKNALLADTNKEIKGIWSAWEGFGVNGCQGRP